jgi:hypothetical protein
MIVEPGGRFTDFKIRCRQQKQVHVQISGNLPNPTDALPLQKFSGNGLSDKNRTF